MSAESMPHTQPVHDLTSRVQHLRQSVRHRPVDRQTYTHTRTRHCDLLLSLRFDPRRTFDEKSNITDTPFCCPAVTLT